jgi:hypothetical protein
MPSTRRTLLVIGVVAALVVASFAALELYPKTFEFQVQVAYQGPWQVSWTSYWGGPAPPNQIGTGGYTGTGNSSRIVSVQISPGDYDKGGVYFCAQASKLDNSHGTLTVSVYTVNGPYPLEMRNTSAPSGSATACGGLIP